MDFKQASELRYRNTPVQEFTTPMVYAKRIEPAGISFIIAQGSHDGLNYYVKNIECRHPTAYVEIPQGHKAYNMDFNNWEYNLIDVHGGVTYQSDGLHCVDPNGERDHKFVGWDYGHAGDYEGYYEGENREFVNELHKWTTEEIVAECIRAIDQINSL